MELNFVKQQARCGCAAACIAMVTGRSYEDVTKDFANDFNADGISVEQIIDYLSDEGFRIIKKEIPYFLGNRQFGRDEMLKPFAPAHIIDLLPKFDSEKSHVVVMDKEGKLFCPSGDTEEETLNSYKITAVLGLYKGDI